MTREIDAHLRAAERNELKRGQHLIAATQYAEANKVPHFGRWSERDITRRTEQQRLRAEERRLKDGPRARTALETDEHVAEQPAVRTLPKP